MRGDSKKCPSAFALEDGRHSGALGERFECGAYGGVDALVCHGFL